MVKNRVLIIEDDDEAAYHLKVYLQECSFFVDIFQTVTDSISHIQFNRYALLLLDINLPDFDGFEVLKFMNQHHIHIPTIVLSAYSTKEYKLHAFKLGACDYVCKPIDPEELEARMWVHLKNKSFVVRSSQENFSIQNGTIFFKERVLKLTKIEFNILSHLMQHRNHTVDRKELLTYLSKKSQNNRSLDYHIQNIRKKISDNGSNPTYLVTEYGIGYKLTF